MTISMNLISWIVVGLIAGFLAGKVLREGFGLIGDLVVGVLGALIGGYLASHLFHIKAAVTGINLETILVSLCGAVLLLVILRLVGVGGRRRSIFR